MKHITIDNHKKRVIEILIYYLHYWLEIIVIISTNIMQKEGIISWTPLSVTYVKTIILDFHIDAPQMKKILFLLWNGKWDLIVHFAHKSSLKAICENNEYFWFGTLPTSPHGLHLFSFR